MKSITIKDIARELGVSASTVSRALQNHPDISEETRRLVHAYAKEHNYRPNMMASNLRTAKNTTVGLLIPSATHYFYASVLKGVEQLAQEAGYSIIIAQSEEDPTREKQALKALVSARVAGILACASKNTHTFEHLSDVANEEIPLVLFDRRCPVECDQVLSDDFSGAFRAVEYLIQTGARKIAYYTSPLRIQTAAERFRGYKEALQKYGIEVNPDLIIECDNRNGAQIMTPDFFANVGVPDAVLAVNDATAAGILQAAKILNIAVPQQMQICGFSNDIIARHTDPMLTTVQQHGRQMGQMAMQMLLDRMQEQEIHEPSKIYVIPTDLIIRESTH